MAWRRRHLLVLVVASIVTLGACQGSDAPDLPPTNPHVDADSIRHYVAMGDSFSSGPGISPKQDGSGICLRSERNYPSLVAAALRVSDFTDVSCAGASTQHILQDIPVRQGLRFSKVSAQMDAASSGTQLVTLTIGYNNEQVFGHLFGACLFGSTPKPGACQTFVRDTLPSVLDHQRGEIVEALQAVRGKAPRATVVLVGYLPILSEPGSCPADVISPADEQNAYEAEASMDDNLRQAAVEAGTEFMSMRRAAAGHGVCDGEAAWVNGGSPQKDDGVVYHPRATGMAAVADSLEKFLSGLS